MVRLIAIVLLMAALFSRAHAQEGNADAGLAYAKAVCAECHAVREGAMNSPNPKAPPFSHIANTPGMTGAALYVILQTPHREMPDLIPSAKEKADLVAYILSLRS
ncbi:MAG: c-type cytochrome [Rhodomicrobium sp.]